MRAGKHQPMDIEWAKDGITGELFILQARPETVHTQREQTFVETYKLSDNHGAPLVSGVAVGEKIAHGKVHVLLKPEKKNLLKGLMNVENRVFNFAGLNSKGANNKQSAIIKMP